MHRWVPGSSWLPFAAGALRRCGLLWKEQFCIRSRRQDPAADAGSFLPTLEKLDEHLEIWPILAPVEVNRFRHHSQWAT